MSRLLSQRTVLIVFGIACALALTVFFVRSAARPGTTTAERADVTNAQAVADGRRLYATRCASCHGGDLRGQPGWPQPRPDGFLPASPLDASGSAWQRSDQWLFTTIQQGGQATAPPGFNSAMPGFGGSLTDAQIWAIISYMKSTWPVQIREAQPRDG